ncbi:MAG: DUF1460 domain-containing protein [Paramuribaculum sp.]
MKRIYLIALAAILLTTAVLAQRPVRFRNETVDTTRITTALIELDKKKKPMPQLLVSEAGKMFISTPYAAGTLEESPEMLTVDTEHLDCTTFVEMATAMAITVANRRTSWRDYVYNLQQLRYRGGNVDGYASRLHYISDWIVDNSHRGLLQEVTDRIGHADYAVKTLDYMTSHRASYPALADSANFAGVKNAEIGYRSHRFPYIKPQNIKNSDIREGDIIAIVTGIKGLDVSHLGIATIVDGKVHLMHASSKKGEVIIDPLPLQEYLRKNRTAIGIRVIRIKD